MEKCTKETKIVFLGTPEFAVGSLKALLDAGYPVVGVVTVPDKPSGRGLKVNMSAVKEFAVSKGLPVLQPVSLKDPSFLESLKGWGADCFVVVAFRMLPEAVWAMPRLGTFNLHASLLPQYRGAAPINWAIINGEKETGVTTFLLDRQIDTGNILFQEKCPILPEDNIGTLYDKLMDIGSALTVKTVEALACGNTNPKAQEPASVLRPAPKITRDTCRIDWNRSAEEISLLVRGLSPYPAAYATIAQGEKKTDVKIFSAFPSSRTPAADFKPGRIISDGKSYLDVVCGNGALEVRELQVSGKKRLTAKEFLPGIHDLDTIHFE